MHFVVCCAKVIDVKEPDGWWWRDLPARQTMVVWWMIENYGVTVQHTHNASIYTVNPHETAIKSVQIGGVKSKSVCTGRSETQHLSIEPKMFFECLKKKSWIMNLIRVFVVVFCLFLKYHTPPPLSTTRRPPQMMMNEQWSSCVTKVPLGLIEFGTKRPTVRRCYFLHTVQISLASVTRDDVHSFTKHHRIR